MEFPEFKDSPFVMWWTRIEQEMNRRGWTAAQLARESGVPVESLYKYLKGNVANPRGDAIEKLAEALDLDPVWVRTGRQSPSDPVDLNKMKLLAEPDGPLDLPVLGYGRGGGNAIFFDNGQVQDRVPRPAELMNVPNAYAVFHSGESMEPRYFAGELHIIHPGLPITKGSFVICELTSGEAYIKEFVRRSDDRVVLRQYNPDREIEIPAGDIKNIHKIYSTRNR